MKSTRLAVTSTVLTLATAAVLTGCSAGGSTPTKTAGPVTLTFWHSAEGATAETLDAIVKDFNESNDDQITIEATYQGKYDDTVAKLSASVQAGDLPDLVQINDVNTAFMVDSGLVAPAEQLVADAGVSYSFDALVPAVANYYTVNDTIYSMPFQASQPAVFVRDDVLAATGETADTFPTTVDGLAEWAERAKAATGKAGLTFHLNPWWFEELTAGAGIEYCTPDNGRGGDPADAFTTADDAQIDQWTTLQGLFADGAALNIGTDFAAGVNALAAGEAGAFFSSSGALGTVTSAMTTDWSVVPFPTDSKKGGVAPGGNSVFAINESLDSDDKKAAAAEFLAYLGSDDVQEQIFTATGFLPTTEPALEAVKPEADPRQTALLDQLANTPDTVPAAGCLSGALQAVRGELTPAIEKIVQGADVASTLGAVQDAATDLVADYNERAGK
ncbi:extracellular solute-binding protein [Microbacterium sp. NPDC058389]|uniref:extracellular solute-binding protein n=1 Tax=Microbacterium sp. NPDC058389 TaxID=3346475 RepID=UPI00365C1901